MYLKGRKSNYDKYPEVKVKGMDGQAWRGYPAILSELKSSIKKLDKAKTIVTIDCYPGVRETEVLTALKEGFNPSLIIHRIKPAIQARKSPK